ncbi:MAG: Rpn family recombination-promoting nuclease/putative transposase [Desulfuromonadaceae bacterium]
MQFVDVKTDIAFKKIFGSDQHTEILIGFLNAVLELEGDRRIKSVTLKNPWQPPDIPILKETILDVRAVDNRDVTFIVEMQIKDTTFFDKRAIYYTSKAYTGQIKKGEDYPKLNQVIFIGILDFNSFEGENYLTRHLILNRETMNQDLRDLEFNFIELKKFNKQEEELKTIVEKWIYFIKNAGNLSMIPKNSEAIPELNEAYKLASMNAWTEEELEIYEYWQIRDAGDRYKIKEEFEKGIEKGIEKKTAEFATVMIKDGESNDKIRKYTGLTDDEIEKLRREV